MYCIIWPVEFTFSLSLFIISFFFFSIYLLFFFFFFFFSSRRRHSRWNCAWSSAVCSSDLSEVADRVGVVPGTRLTHPVLPLRLGRKSLAGPGGVRVGFVVADVADRQAGVDRPGAVQGVLEPDPVEVEPVERRVPALRLDLRPAVGEPELRAPVATVGHEREPLAVGDQAVGQPVRLQVDLVLGQ